MVAPTQSSQKNCTWHPFSSLFPMLQCYWSAFIEFHTVGVIITFTLHAFDCALFVFWSPYHHIFLLSLLIFSAFFLLSSCEKSLVETPHSILTAETFFKTKSDAYAALYAVFAVLQQQNYYQRTVYLISDILIIQQTQQIG